MRLSAFSYNSVKLDNKSGDECQCCDAAELGHAKGCDGEESAQERHNHNEQQQDKANDKGCNAGGVGAKAQLEDALLTAAVEAVEQAGQSQGGEGHGAAQQLAAGIQTDVEGGHGAYGNKAALYINVF